MSRTAARISHDEVARMVKAVKSLGLPIARVSYDGNRVDVIIGESGEIAQEPVDRAANDEGLIREPQA